MVIHGGEIEQGDRGLENSYRRKNGGTVGAQKLMIGNMLRNRAHFVEKGDFSYITIGVGLISYGGGVRNSNKSVPCRMILSQDYNIRAI